MLRILLLILALAIGSTATAQTTENMDVLPMDLPPPAEKVFEVGLTTIENFDSLFDAFLQGELKKEPTASGYIINYGADREVAGIESYIRDRISLRKFDRSRIVMVRGGFRQERKTEFWFIPSGSFPPTIEWRPHKIDFFDRLNRSDFKRRLVSYLVRLRKSQTGTGYIIIDGSGDYAAGQEKLIRGNMRFRRFEANRITIVRGRVGGKPETQFWLLPEGATADDIERFKKEIQ